MNAPKQAAYYARVSTDLQVDNTSLPEQREICEATIKARGWELVDTYPLRIPSSRCASSTVA